MDAIQRNRGKDQGSAGASPHLISLTHRTPRFIGEQENLFHQFTFSRVSRFLFQSQIANQKSKITSLCSTRGRRGRGCKGGR